MTDKEFNALENVKKAVALHTKTTIEEVEELSLGDLAKLAKEVHRIIELPLEDCSEISDYLKSEIFKEHLVKKLKVEVCHEIRSKKENR